MTLYAPYDDQNIFAQIMRGEAPCVRVFEDGNVLAIMDVFPQSRGHVLVMPKTPSRNLLEVHAKDVGRLFGATQRIAVAVEKALKPDGIVVTQFNGAPAGQTVFHTHVHIIPRYSDEALAAHGSEMADTDALAKIAQKIRAHL
ncbi:HIT family protein [Litorimonas sp. RW-G-Af-16]|uniref:HIT family protein n=1 Tax=Litorimonas sp. RW-G-Af-16 TaxID=3241168 RepID=UPI00390CCD6A